MKIFITIVIILIIVFIWLSLRNYQGPEFSMKVCEECGYPHIESHE